MKHANIPDHWSGHEALSFAAFLERIIHAIWRAHGHAMAQRLLLDLDNGPVVVAPRTRATSNCRPPVQLQFDVLAHKPGDPIQF